ncbi:MAG: RNA pyrophosphohydrolase [Pseudomonadota bacterium]|nr:RNA pyrophosphohydrolase [Pseudomonadota bacterium]
MASDSNAGAYRPGVGIMLLNRHGLVFGGRRIDTPGTAWQMPQGGIDEGESPRCAAMRELKEETGIDKAKIIAESRGWLSYDLPPEMAATIWGGRYRGQRQKWFAARFFGYDEDFDLNAHEPEFAEWKWLEAGDLPRFIVPFKRQLYLDVLAEFRDILNARA